MICKYEYKDLNQIVDLWIRASVIAHSFIPDSYWISKAKEMKELYIPNSTLTLVYQENEEVKGFISLMDNFIAALFVAPSEQGKGIGTCLLDEVKSNFDELKLAVYTENVKSLNYYLKQGFLEEYRAVEENTGHEEIIMKFVKNG